MKKYMIVFRLPLDPPWKYDHKKEVIEAQSLHDAHMQAVDLCPGGWEIETVFEMK